MPIYKMKGSKDGLQKYRIRINYHDISGNARQIDSVAYGLDNAKELEMRLNHDIKKAAPARKMTLQKLYDEYAETKRHEVRESSLDKSKRILQRYILPELGEYQLNRLTLPILQKWKLSIANTNLAQQTKKNVYGEFHTLLNYAVKMEYLPNNPLDKVGNFKDKLTVKKEMLYYTPEEFKKYLAAARENAEKAEKSGDMFEWHYYVFFAIAFYTGLRKGEIHGLKWDDINGDYLSVKRSITQKLGNGDRETPPKNRSSIRTLQMPRPLKNILNEHYNRCKDAPNFNEQCKVCGIFKPLRDSTLEKRNRQFAESAGVKKIRIHDFRHSHASLLANEGINIQEIAKRLGHSKIEITWNTYSHLYPREEERAIKILDKIV